MPADSGVTVYLHVRGEDSEVNYPRASTARIENDGSLTLLGRGESAFDVEPVPVGSIANGLWIRWIYEGQSY